MRIFRKNLFHALAVASTATLLCACTINQKQLTTASSQPKHIAIFFDGTNNEEESDTNVKRLHSLMTLQRRPDIATFYVEGVGSEKSVIGMGTGWGFKDRVKPAYQFLLDNYRPGDKIYVFGFSRGAFSARVLASLLYHAGLPQHARLSSGDIAEIVFDEVKDELTTEQEADRRGKVHGTLNREHGIVAGKAVDVDIMGLWDTVEALGFPHWGPRIKDKMGIAPYPVDIDIPNRRYGDQLCNVKHAFHALSIDDNREWIFTPLLLGREALFRQCGKAGAMLDADGRIIPGRLAEVWFSGAHSDVGGGYQDSMLSGVSLNWMLDRIANTGTGILPPNTAVNEDPFGRSHDPESGKFAPLYHNINRNIGAYLTDEKKHRGEFAGTMCVHPSVLERRRTVPTKRHENDYLTLTRAGKICLTKKGKFSNPPILKQVSQDAGYPCGAEGERQLEIQVWPDCKGQPPK